jgi:2-iminobutanoate/2-iminopropanoate deaminase
MTNLSAIPLSPARRAGNLLILSGQLGFESPGVLAAGGIEAQTRQAIANIEAILKAEGADLSHVVRTGVWLVDKGDFAAFNSVYAALFKAPYPARSTVVSELVIPGALVEIEALALLP